MKKRPAGRASAAGGRAPAAPSRRSRSMRPASADAIGLKGRWSSASPLIKRLGKVVAFVSMIGALAGVYEGVAPADWVRPSYLWAVPRPVMTQLTVSSRGGVCDPRGYGSDCATVTAMGASMPAALRLRDLRLVAFWRLPQEPGAAWRVSEKDGLIDLMDATECVNENWECRIGSVRCAEHYAGDIQVVLALIPAARDREEARRVDRGQPRRRDSEPPDRGIRDERQRPVLRIPRTDAR